LIEDQFCDNAFGIPYKFNFGSTVSIKEFSVSGTSLKEGPFYDLCSQFSVVQNNIGN
jgi:hypothetical protein